MRAHISKKGGYMRQNQKTRPNFVLVNEHLYRDFASFCRTYTYQNPSTQIDQKESEKNTSFIQALPDNASDFILIDNQTGLIIR